MDPYVEEGIRRGLIDTDPIADEARRRGIISGLTSAETALLRERGENIAEPQPIEGFWDRAAQTFREHKNLDQNLLAWISQKLGRHEIDPATGKPRTVESVRRQQDMRRERDRYLTAPDSPEPPPGSSSTPATWLASSARRRSRPPP